MNSYESLLSNQKEQQSIRDRTKAILMELHAATTVAAAAAAATPAPLYKSWVRGEHDPTSYSSSSSSCPLYPSPSCRFFDQHGFLHIPSFSTQEEISSMKQHMQHLVETQWDPHESDKRPSVFRTDDKQIEEQGSDDYFLESAYRIHFFAERLAMVTSTEENDHDSDRKTTNNSTTSSANTTMRLKEEYLKDPSNKINALNKAGHGLHLERPSVFHTYTTSSKIRDIVHELGWTDPCVPQSMYIFKQARVGSEVTSHQDSTFLYTVPRQTCLGLWLALDDATIENGCLWVRPGSHWEPTRVRFARNPEYFGQDVIDARGNVAKGDKKNASQMIFVQEAIDSSDDVSKKIDWVGKIPQVDGMSPWDSLLACGFIPVECKAGDLVVFPGELDHLSLPNVSDQPRHTFQLHLVEGEGAGVTWAESNWLQYPPGMSFLRLDDAGVIRGEAGTER